MPRRKGFSDSTPSTLSSPAGGGGAQAESHECASALLPGASLPPMRAIPHSFPPTHEGDVVHGRQRQLGARADLQARVAARRPRHIEHRRRRASLASPQAQLLRRGAARALALLAVCVALAEAERRCEQPRDVGHAAGRAREPVALQLARLAGERKVGGADAGRVEGEEGRGLRVRREVDSARCPAARLLQEGRAALGRQRARWEAPSAPAVPEALAPRASHFLRRTAPRGPRRRMPAPEGGRGCQWHADERGSEGRGVSNRAAAPLAAHQQRVREVGQLRVEVDPEDGARPLLCLCAPPPPPPWGHRGRRCLHRVNCRSIGRQGRRHVDFTASFPGSPCRFAAFTGVASAMASDSSP